MGWFCKNCGDYRFDSVKKCHCKEFTVIDEDGEEHLVWGMTDEGAALKYAETSNVDGDYYLMNESAEVSVNGKSFKIGAEPDVHYWVKEA